DVLEASVFKESEHQSVVVSFSELAHGRFQQGLDLVPGIRISSVQLRLHIGFLFPVLSPPTQGQSFGGCISGRAVKPGGNHGLGTERTSLTRQDDEDGLRNLLRQVRVANLTQRNGIDQIDVPRYEGGERLLGFASCILPHEVHVIDHHSIYTSTQTRQSNNYFFEPVECPRLDEPITDN